MPKQEEANGRKVWTIMFYFASDNPLAPSVISQLKAIQSAGFHPQANVIAHFDPHTKDTPSHTFEVNLSSKLKYPRKSQVGFTANDPYVRSLVLDKLWGEGDEKIIKSIQEYFAAQHIVYKAPVPKKELSEEQGPKASLCNFLNFCKDKYPADRYMLFILGHGMVVGNNLFLYDENAPLPTLAESPIAIAGKQKKKASEDKNQPTPAQHSLSLKDFGEVLRCFKKRIGPDSEFELIGFHSCSMSALEVAYEIQGTANYMMASQGPAFVGSLPYRPILLRLFNDLMMGKEDLWEATGLVTKLKVADDPVCQYLVKHFNPDTRKLLDQHNEAQDPGEELLDALVDELNDVLNDPDFFDHCAQHIKKLSPATRRISKKKEKVQAQLNRCLLQDAFPNEISVDLSSETGEPKIQIMRIFKYCMINSLDFFLGGYSFDLCLCDLTQLKDRKGQVTAAFKNLSKALTNAVRDPLLQERILLAHWDAQSYWSEQYTDLFDFCYCLYSRCGGNKKSRPANPALREIRDACVEVMKGLKWGIGELIVRSRFVGPAYQYSHGLSVYFPWSAPVDRDFWKQYVNYSFSKRTGWHKFLREYFEKTRRPPRSEDQYPAGTIFPQPPSSKKDSTDFAEELLDQSLPEFADNIARSDSRLGKEGSGDRTGKEGSGDRSGDDCTCPSIKNYPPYVYARPKARKRGQKG